MDGLFYLILVVTVVFVLTFVGYYSWRLMRLRAPRDDSSARLRALLNTQTLDGANSVAPGGPGGSAGAPEGSHIGAGPVPSLSEAGGTVGAARVYERRMELRTMSATPVFMSRDKTGEITVQVDSRPSMPLRYVLDPRARPVLQEVASLAVLEWGDRWSLLASEDEQGRLVLTRLA